MKKGCGPSLLLLSVLCLGGGILSLTEPAAFLDERTALLLLRWMKPENRGCVRGVILPRGSAVEEVAKEVTSLKKGGVRGILLLLPPNDVEGLIGLRKAPENEEILWVADPARTEMGLRNRITCRPLLVCSEFGSAVIAEDSAGTFPSATALALTCLGDMATVRQIGSSGFKLLFHRERYGQPGSATNLVLACITRDEMRNPTRYNTPGGQETASEYALDISQALLDRRYLIESRAQTKCLLAGVLAPLLGCIRNRGHGLALLAALLAAMLCISLVGKILLPTGTTILLYILASAAIPICSPEHDSTVQ